AGRRAGQALRTWLGPFGKPGRARAAGARCRRRAGARAPARAGRRAPGASGASAGLSAAFYAFSFGHGQLPGVSNWQVAVTLREPACTTQLEESHLYSGYAYNDS